MKTNILYGKIADLFPNKGTVLVADDYFRGKGLLEAWDRPILWIHAAEEEKTLATVERITAQLIELQVGRDAFLLGVGGGITSDITGFVASVYKRGIRFGLVPTTLLAQVDAAVGGKNGVNFDRYKNMLGCFRLPEFVYIDTSFLRTLPRRAVLCGAAEMLKTFLLADEHAYEEAVAHFRGPQPERIPATLVRRAAQIKDEIVEQDPEDHGKRQLLNLGHTFGHAIERCCPQYAHGEAVAIGIVAAARMAADKGIAEPALAEHIAGDFAAIGLPVEVPVDPAQLRQAILQDKKRQGDAIRFILPERIGKARIWEESATA